MRYKVKSGTIRIGGQTIAAGKVFEADSVPQAFMDSIELLDTPPEEPKPVMYYTKEKRSPGWWDVVGPDGKPINEGALREADADKLLSKL